MSDDCASRLKSCGPSACFRFRTTLRLPRLTALKLGLSEPDAPTICRVESPDGGSILMTSAPRSARIVEQKGPAMNCVTSRTRTSSSARAGREVSLRSESVMKDQPRLVLVLNGGVIVHHPCNL